jgi:hypothetical protein
MTFGTRLKLEGRSPTSPEWGVFNTVSIEAESGSETLDSATRRARRHLAGRAVAGELQPGASVPHRGSWPRCRNRPAEAGRAPAPCGEPAGGKAAKPARAPRRTPKTPLTSRAICKTE